MKIFYTINKSFNIDLIKKLSSKEDFDILSEKMSRFTFKKGQELLQQNTNPIGIYWIREGNVKSFKTLNGKTQILRFYKKGQIFGYECILSERKHPYSIEALEEVEVLIIPKDEFLNLIFNNKELSKQLLIITSNNMLDTEEHFMDVVYKSVKVKIAEVILSANRVLTTGEDGEIGIYKSLFNRENFASLIGTTRETVIRILSDMKKEGLIEVEGKHIQILNKKQLKNISGSF